MSFQGNRVSGIFIEIDQLFDVSSRRKCTTSSSCDDDSFDVSGITIQFGKKVAQFFDHLMRKRIQTFLSGQNDDQDIFFFSCLKILVAHGRKLVFVEIYKIVIDIKM